MADSKDRGPYLDIAEKWLPRERYGIPLIQSLLPCLFQLKILREANERIFQKHMPLKGPEEELMDKYAVEIDPDKVEKEKVGSKGGKPTTDPNVNIPLDPDKGSEPFEKEPADGSKKGS